MLIRKLTASDGETFRDFRIEMCRESPEAFSDTPEEVAAFSDEKVKSTTTPSAVYPEKFILAAFEGERLLATVAFHREENFKARHRGWIWGVYVRPEARGRGISRQLMKQVIEETSRIDGLEILGLVVSSTQTGARTLYASLGFITTGLFLDAYKFDEGHYVDHEIMMLRLKK